MLKGKGAKYIGRALCLWGAERDFTNSVERARKEIPLVFAADPDMVLEACVFEIVGQRVSQIPIPDWVFTAFGHAVTNRNFICENMIYPANMRRSKRPSAPFGPMIRPSSTNRIHQPLKSLQVIPVL